MNHVSDTLGDVITALDPARRKVTYEASGARVLCRSGGPHWLTLDEAEREAFRLTAELVRADDPGLVLPRFTELAWAIRDAREADNDPTPPAAIAQAA